MLDQLTNDGLAFLGAPIEVAEPATLIVVGAPRSGTSMAAAALYHLGVFMGDDIGQGTYEDQRIARAIEKEPETLADVVRDYNRHPVWGFKRPMAFTVIEGKLPFFRNPRIIATFRDPVAIAKRNVVSMGKDFAEQFKAAVTRNHRLCDLVLRLPMPVMTVSYEKAVASPSAFTEAIAHFAGLNVPPESISKAAAYVRNGPEHYLLSSQTRFPEFTGKAPKLSPIPLPGSAY